MKIKNLYYVYKHIDPDNGELLYVGMGTGSRAWASGTSSGSSRSNEHAAWISDRYEEGYTMSDITLVIETLLNKEQALSIELNLIKEFKPRFNRLSKDFVNKKYTKEQAKEALTLFKSGVRYCDIPRELGLTSSNMSVLGKRMVESGEKFED